MRTLAGHKEWTLPHSLLMAVSLPSPSNDLTSRQTLLKQTERITGQVNRTSTNQVQKMILSMGDGYMTMSEIMASMELKHLPSFRENYFLPALEDGAIELQYPEQPKHPKQKYRLTEAAKEWLRNNIDSSKS